MLTRLPSGRRQSTSGLASSTRRPTAEAIFCARTDKLLNVAETRVRQTHLAGDFDEHPIGAIDHDLGDPLVEQEFLQRTVADHVGGQVLGKPVLIASRKLQGVRGRPTRGRPPGSDCVVARATSCRSGRCRACPAPAREAAGVAEQASVSRADRDGRGRVQDTALPALPMPVGRRAGRSAPVLRPALQAGGQTSSRAAKPLEQLGSARP